MTVKEILTKWLSNNGYSGLCHPESECGCGLEDLIVCEMACDECVPARHVACPDCHDTDCDDRDLCNGCYKEADA